MIPGILNFGLDFLRADLHDAATRGPKEATGEE